MSDEPSRRLAEASSFLATLATNPVHTCYLSVFARVQAVRRSGRARRVDVDIAEARLNFESYVETDK